MMLLSGTVEPHYNAIHYSTDTVIAQVIWWLPNFYWTIYHYCSGHTAADRPGDQFANDFLGGSGRSANKRKSIQGGLKAILR